LSERFESMRAYLKALYKYYLPFLFFYDGGKGSLFL